MEKKKSESAQFPADSILHLNALPVRSLTADTPEAGLELMSGLLDSLGINRAREIVELLSKTHGMRGAILLDADTLEHLEPDPERGVRATMMDSAESGSGAHCSPCKNHYAEAMVLAAKVANAPGIVAELCISDDPDGDVRTGFPACFDRRAPLKIGIRRLFASGQSPTGNICCRPAMRFEVRVFPDCKKKTKSVRKWSLND